MKRTAAVFDLDGTLMDTLEDLADCMNEVLAGMDMPVHPVDAYRYFVGQGIARLAASAAPAGTPPSVVADITAAMGEVYGRNWARKSRPYPGIAGLLRELRTRDVALCVLSNKPDVFTRKVVAHFFPDQAFAVVAGARDDVPRKPDPTAALAIARSIGREPSDCLYLGDTDTDMRTGLAAGMFTIGVAWGFRPAAELSGAGAQAIIEQPEQALHYLEADV